MIMTTYTNELPSAREFFAAKLHSKLVNKKARQVSARVPAVLNALIRLGLHLAGFSLLTIAAWQWDLIAGLCAAGISCFALSTLLTRSNGGGETDEAGTLRRAPDWR